MKNDVREMIKNVIEENAIKFKTSTSNTLYQKIGNRLKDEYKNVAKKMFKSINESAETSISQGVDAEFSSEAEAAVAPPQGPNNRQRGDEPKPGYVNPDPDMDRPDMTIDDWLEMRPDPKNYDIDFDGRLSDWERALFEQELRKWYDNWARLYEQWYHWRRRLDTRPYPAPRIPPFHRFRDTTNYDIPKKKKK